MGISLESLQDSKRSLLSDKQMLEQQMSSKSELFEQAKEELENEWKYKLQCRELVLDSLEKTTVIQGESIERLQKQLDEQDEDRGNMSRNRTKYSSSISLSSKETATSKETVSDDDNIPPVRLERKNSCVPASA